MRDGNDVFSVEERKPIKVVSLPMRDGNKTSAVAKRVSYMGC